jgi:hypothetical protein
MSEFYIVQFSTMILLALAANTSFGGMPVLTSLLAQDNHLPHVFALRADRRVYRHGVIRPGRCGAASAGDLEGQHAARWCRSSRSVCSSASRSPRSAWSSTGTSSTSPGWRGRSRLNGLGRGADLRGHDHRAGGEVHRGRLAGLRRRGLLGRCCSSDSPHLSADRPGAAPRRNSRMPPEPKHSLVVVPVGAVNRLTQEAIGVALSLGDDVRAVTVCLHRRPGRHRYPRSTARTEWNAWHPNVPLTVLSHADEVADPPDRRLSQRELDALDEHDRVVLLIPEINPDHHVAAAAAEPARRESSIGRSAGTRRGDLPPAVPHRLARPNWPSSGYLPCGTPTEVYIELTGEPGRLVGA